MTDVEIGLGAVVGDENLAVLEGVHGARIHVQVWIELLHGHPQPAGPEQAAEAGGRQALAETGSHAPGDEQVPGQCRA